SMLIKSGSTVEEAIAAIANELEHASTRRTLLSVRNALQEGSSFSEALSGMPKAFPPYYRSVVSAGQSSGRLGDVMESLAEHLEKSQKLTRKLTSALIYPVVLSIVAIVIVTLMMIFVVPAVVEQFDTLEQELPALTQVVMAISSFVRNWGWIALPAMIGVIVLLRQIISAPPIKASVERFQMRLPIFGGLMKSVNAARFARTFATLSSSGATVPDSLIAAEGSVGSQVFKQNIRQVRSKIEEGQPLNLAMRQSGIFPAMLVHMVASGERGGNLPDMMTRAADYMEEELDNNATVALGLVEPMMIVVLAGAVALIVLAIMLPILQLNTLAIGP
ncbi:MAG: type II secretion system F family protein, partial [Pseudomonadota bacterium]